MDLITAASLILALIPQYQRERDKRECNNRDDFNAWLLEHKFQDIKDCITNNFELGIQIENLLGSNHEELQHRFDQVDEALLQIMHEIDIFRGFVNIVAPSVALSDQKKRMLQQFVNSGGHRLELMQMLQGDILQTDNGVNIEVIDPRTFEASLDELAVQGFLMETRNRYGKSFRLTERAVEFVSLLNKAGSSS